jgi:hypothetical protein
MLKRRPLILSASSLALSTSVGIAQSRTTKSAGADAEILLATETRQNQTSNRVTKAPVSFVLVLDDGAVTASDTLVLRDSAGNLIPTTHWQWNERSSYPSGALRSCVISCLSPLMAPSATAGWRVLKTAGVRPAETNTRTVASITSSYSANVLLSNVVTIRPTAPLHATRGSGTFIVQANEALLSKVTRKEHAGPIRTKWWTWRKFVDQARGTTDAYLWAEFEFDEWIDPDTGQVIHLHCTPRLRNGWARSGTGTFPTIYQCQLRNGTTVLHDYSRSATYQTTDVIARGIANTHAKLPYGKGNAIRVSSGGPGNMITGKWYAIAGWDSPQMLTNLSVRVEDNWSNGPLLSFSSASGSFTVTTGTVHGPGRICEAVNDDGAEHVLLGLPLLYPAWTMAEKRARQDAGLFLPVNLQVLPRERVNDYLTHTLGGANFHRGALDDTGGSLHIGDLTFWCADALRGMTPARVRRVRMSAAEAAQSSYYSRMISDEINPETGVEFATITPLNNGPKDSGRAYPGLPPGRPFARIHFNAPSYFTSTGWPYNDMNPGFTGGADGSHLTAAHHHDFAMFGTTRYLKLSLEIHGTCMALWVRDNAAHGNNRAIRSRNYYLVSAIGNGSPINNARAHGQMSHMLSLGCYLADWRPERAYVDDVVKDNFDYMIDGLADGTQIDALTKRIGWLVSGVNGGTDQHWFNARTQHGTLALLKRSGWGNPTNRDTIIEWATNFSMIHARASRSGVNVNYSHKPWQYAPSTGEYPFWAATESLGRVVTAATTNIKSEADMGTLSASLTFNDNNSVTLTLNAGVRYGAVPLTGDEFVYPNAFVWPGRSTPPPGSITPRRRFWIYDVTGAGTTRTARISSTPGPSWTPVTWSGSTSAPTFVIWTRLQGPPTGPEWNPSLQYNSNSFGYAPQMSAPLACAARWFRKEDCIAPFQAFLSGPFMAFTGGYLHSGSSRPQDQIDTQTICDV